MSSLNRQQHHYRVAERNICVEFCESPYNGVQLIPSFLPFKQENNSEELFFHVCVDDNLRPYDKQELDAIKEIDNGNGRIKVDKHRNSGGYQLIMKSTNGRNCCLLQINKDFSKAQCALRGDTFMRQYGLNSALMILFSMRGGYFDMGLIHASVVRHNNLAYAFIAKSGTGKSTQVSFWLRYIEGCDLVNDDSPAVRVIGDEVYLYGTPWSGKTPCYRNVKVKLGAITHIDRATENSIEPLVPLQAVAVMLPACSTMIWDKVVFDHTCNFLTRIIELVNVYTLHCLPNREAAIICHKAISK